MNIWCKRWVGILLCLAVGSGARAAVSQMPLTGTTGSVMPNLMFTLDDSGSMGGGCASDVLCTASTLPWKEGAAPDLYITYDSNDLLARRLRSAAINPIYYNPAIRYLPWLKADGSRYAEYPAEAARMDPNSSVTYNLVEMQTLSRYWQTQTGYFQGTQTVWPAQYYRLNNDMLGNSIGDFTPVIISSETRTYSKGPNRSDCLGSVCTYEEEKQNFSNWFTYASTRMKVAKSGTAEAFPLVPSGFRVGFGSINTSQLRDVDGVATKTILMGVRPFNPNGRERFYSLLLGIPPIGGSTPLLRALDDVGRYFLRQDTRSPWAGDTENGEPLAAHHSCRRSFHVLMTDGGWNDSSWSVPASAQNFDDTDGPDIESHDGAERFRYRPAPPYRGVSSPSLADVAMYYWNRDLQPNLKNDLAKTDSNPAFWQHLVNHTIGLGVSGDLHNPKDWPALVAGTKDWGNPGSVGASAFSSKIDDLWHAAVNSRGRSASASSVVEYTSALKSMIESIIGSGGREAGIAVSGRSYSAESSVKYIPSYQPGDWTGEIEARWLKDGNTLWSASKLLPDAAARNIYTLSPDSLGVSFTASAMNTATQGLLDTAEPVNLINYVRGDRTKEDVSYRKRISLLGDIVNSAPILVKDLVDSQYDFLSSDTPGQSSYLRYANTKKYRAPQLFVGANDGMLHAFNANTGVESFAYIPRSVLGRLKNLANPAYDHQYFVDGPLTEVDIYDTTNAKWRNLVVGSTGAGAKSLFAINMPVPDIPSSGEPMTLTATQSAPGAADILWEISSANPSYSDLGNVLQAPEAGVMQDGTWVVITGNGYDSASGRAKLYVINARTGARVAVLTAGTDVSNGLGGVKLVRDRNKRIVAAYAGDLAGHLWKFDFSSATPAQWNVAFSGSPLFSATNSAGQPEPFTAAPTVVPHPLGGVMVLAGTGKLFESDDASSTSEKSLYGIWDKASLGGNVNATDLVTQTIQSLTINQRTGDYFSISSNGVDYGTGATARKRGWMIRMTIASGQRLIYTPQIESGRVIFDTMVPGGVATGCTATQPQGYTFVLDPFTGAPGRDGPTFDTNNDSFFTSADNANAAVTHFSSIGQRRIVRLPGTSEVRLEGPGAPGDPSGADSSKNVRLGGTPVRRQWRQIATPPLY